MMWGRKKQPALTSALAVEHLLTRLPELPVGRAVVLVDRADDSLLVKRHAKHTFVFRRTGDLGKEQ